MISQHVNSMEFLNATVIPTFVMVSTFTDEENCNGAVYLVQTTHASGNSFRTYIPPVCLVVSARCGLWLCFMEVLGLKMWLIRLKETFRDTSTYHKRTSPMWDVN